MGFGLWPATKFVVKVVVIFIKGNGWTRGSRAVGATWKGREGRSALASRVPPRLANM